MLFFIIVLLAFVFQLFLPWWIITPLAFGAAFWKGKTASHAFWSGFFAVFVLWIITGLFYSIPNGHILANRVGAMLGLPETSINWAIVLLISGILGGLAAGFCSLAGYYCREAMVVPEKAPQ
ncbi:MAG: hypothetical protein V4721_06375 [Bacteroidota bacterium]